jgi:hypothetical protein
LLTNSIKYAEGDERIALPFFELEVGWLVASRRLSIEGADGNNQDENICPQPKPEGSAAVCGTLAVAELSQV